MKNQIDTVVPGHRARRESFTSNQEVRRQLGWDLLGSANYLAAERNANVHFTAVPHARDRRYRDEN